MTPLIVPSRSAVAGSQLSAFASHCEQATGRSLASAAAMHAFSVEDFRLFWRLFLSWSGLPVSGNPEPVCDGSTCERAVFFPRLRLNYVECLLAGDPGDDERPALSALREDGATTRWSRAELARRVLAIAHHLKEMGVQAGDRVVAVASSTAETVAACLGSVAVGATWSSVAPDLGAPAILARLAPLEPKVLFFHSTAREGGAVRDLAGRIETVRAGLPTLLCAVSLDDAAGMRNASGVLPLSKLAAPGDGPRRVTDLPRFSWNHPLFIAFSSGTTGRPKCLVHGAGGTLIEQHKEHRLHGDLERSDKLYFHTTPGWMMWNWLLSALACRTEIVLYEGSIIHPRPDALWEAVARERVTVFGTSPAFLQYSRDAGFAPGDLYDFSALRTLQSTGSVLKDSLFHWVAEAVKPVPVQSISGGTDIMGCFLLGHPWLPVYPGELQSKSLGLDVASIGDGNLGELVCKNPFPSRPIGIYGDPSGARLHESYFAQNPGTWTHGDLVEWTPRGTARIHGRTDGVLNVRGVRIGPSELYAALEPVDAIADCMALEQRAPEEPGGSRLVLLLVLRPGRVLDKDLQSHIRRTLVERCSPAHVPEVIVHVEDVVRTHNGKRAERAARDALNGDLVQNLDALANPHVLDALRVHPELALPKRMNGHATGASPPTIRSEGASPDAILARLLPLWQEVIGSDSVTPDDDFQELGGHSLLAISLLLKVRAAFGTQLPMGVFLGAGQTPAGMASLLRGAHADGLVNGDASSLVTLQPKGHGTPIIWMPGGGAVSTMAFRELSLLLGEERPIYGFEAPVVDDVSLGPVELEELAARHVRELQARIPGPYAIFGFSLGSYMAFEVACQLVAGGETVAPLVLFDEGMPRESRPGDQVRAALHRIRYHLGKLRRGPRAHASFLAGQLRDRFEHRVAKAKAEPVVGRELFDAVSDRNLDAIARYKRRPLRLYPGRITVILATDTSKSALPPDLDPRLGWRYQAQRGFEVYRVPGTHLSMLRRPDAVHLAAALAACLASAEEARRPTVKDGARSSQALEPLHTPNMLKEPDELHYALRLESFRTENAQLGPPVGDRVILLGDSHVELFDVTRFGARDVLNRGIISDHLDIDGVSGLLHRWHPSLLGRDPSHVFVMVGVNDLASGVTVSECMSRYESLIGCLRSSEPGTRIVCQTVPPTHSRFGHLNGQILHFNRSLLELASACHVDVLDVHGKLKGDGPHLDHRYSTDGLHLRQKGYALWRDAISAFMGWPRTHARIVDNSAHSG